MEIHETNKKRKRGGQPGNRNALKHGFYAQGGKSYHEQANALIRECHLLLDRLMSGETNNISGLFGNLQNQKQDCLGGGKVPYDR